MDSAKILILTIMQVFVVQCGGVDCCSFERLLYRDIFDKEGVSEKYENEVLMGKPIVIPIGANCSCTLLVREIGLRFLSYPFDWYRTSADTLCDIMGLSLNSNFVENDD